MHFNKYLLQSDENKVKSRIQVKLHGRGILDTLNVAILAYISFRARLANVYVMTVKARDTRKRETCNSRYTLHARLFTLDTATTVVYDEKSRLISSP